MTWWVFGSIWCAYTALRPDPAEHLRWYDRLIRAIGALILLTFLVFEIALWSGRVPK